MNSLWWTNRQIKNLGMPKVLNLLMERQLSNSFNLNTVTVLEPARKQMNEKLSDCVVWMDGRTRTQ